MAHSAADQAYRTRRVRRSHDRFSSFLAEAQHATALCRVCAHSGPFTEPIYGRWRKDDDESRDAFTRKIEADILPLLDTFATIEGDTAYWADPARGFFSQRHPYSQLTDFLALGEIDTAREMLRDELNRNLWTPSLKQLGLKDALLQDTGPLPRPLVQRLVDRLHQNEERNVAAEGLAGLWDRTPLPIETRLLS